MRSMPLDEEQDILLPLKKTVEPLESVPKGKFGCCRVDELG
jgi:hypothetical protein